MQINLAKKTRYLTEEAAHKASLRYGRKNLGTRDVRLENIELVYKPFYFLKVLALASRKPFKPKRSGYVLFFDSVLGRGGLTPGVPVWEEVEVPEGQVWDASFPLEKFEEVQPALVEKFIMRRYLLKRPDLQYQGLDRVWLPYYLCFYAAGASKTRVVLNAETGRLDI